MAKKPATPVNEKFQNQEFDLFEALDAIDRKDYAYYDRLTSEQQRKFVPFMMLHWISAVKSSSNIQSYYLQSVEYHANKYLFNEMVQKHPKLQWLMLCAASPGLGKQFHVWIPHIRDRVSKLKERPKQKEIKDYYKKIYSKASDKEINMITSVYIESQGKKCYIADRFPEMKFEDIEILSELITEEDISEFEEALGN